MIQDKRQIAYLEEDMTPEHFRLLQVLFAAKLLVRLSAART